MKRLLIFTVVFYGFVFSISIIPASAQKENISSKGNITLGTGTDVAIYAEDINYLQNEINKLFNEIN